MAETRSSACCKQRQTVQTLMCGMGKELRSSDNIQFISEYQTQGGS